MPPYIGMAMILGIAGGLVIDAVDRTIGAPVEYIAEEAPQEVLIESHIDWTPERIKSEIRKVFHEEPETFVKIAKCESGLLPHAHNAKTNDGGILQINDHYHGERLKELGLDPFKVEDNLKYGRMLYDEFGKQPWSASKHCWQ